MIFDNESKTIFMKNSFFFTLVFILLVGFLQSQSTTPTVKIVTQEWRTKNLDVVTFRNGDTIPEAKTNEEWQKAREEGKPAWCYYDNDPKNGEKYGKLYNWYAVNDSRGLAPKGYHVPTKAEWDSLVSYLGGEEIAGKKIKSTEGWLKYFNDENGSSYDGNGTNESDFLCLPGGYSGYYGDFGNVGNFAFFWSCN